MSTTATTGARETQADMNNYVQPHHPPPAMDPRSRQSSAASKYVPDGYPTRPSTEKTDSMAYLAPDARRAPLTQPGGPFTPSDPEQYRVPPATFSGTVPPAQLPPYYQDNRYLAQDGYDRPDTRHRRASATSYYSDRSRRSSHSHSHRDGDRHRHSHEHGHSHSKDKKKRHFDDPVENDKYLTRKNTPRRSYGGSLFALFDSVKEALKGN